MSITQEKILTVWPRVIERMKVSLSEQERGSLKILIKVWNREGGETVRLHIGFGFMPFGSRDCRARWQACMAHGCDARTRAKFPAAEANQSDAHRLGHALTTKVGETLMLAGHTRAWDEALAISLALELGCIPHDFPTRHARPEARAIIATA